MSSALNLPRRELSSPGQRLSWAHKKKTRTARVEALCVFVHSRSARYCAANTNNPVKLTLTDARPSAFISVSSDLDADAGSSIQSMAGS